MTSIKLSDSLSVDAVEYASRANAILGIRDSGKTYTGTLIAEQLYNAGIPFFAFDPIGRWRFLKVPGKGGGRGFPIVVAGGAAPDLELTPENAPALVRAAMRSGISMVIDLYSIGLSKRDWRAIVRNSIETILYEGDGHGQRHVFLEEAAEFIPQHIRDGNTYAAVEKLARMGGNVGVGVTLINQRAEEVNKAVLELCDNLLLHRQRGKNSLLSLRKWLAAGNVSPPKEITDTLADLPTGQCWAWFKDVGKPVLIKVAKKQSFDPDRRAMAINRSAAAKAAPDAVDVTVFVGVMKAALAGKPVKLEPAKPAPRPAVEVVLPPKPTQEPDVKESEARALREQNTELSHEVRSLRAQLAARQPPSDPAVAPNGAAIDLDTIMAEIIRRARTEPAILKILTTRPELTVAVARKTVEIDGTSLKGRIAKLIATGFYNNGATHSATRAELKRTGPEANSGNTSKSLADFVRDGFLTNESSGNYTAVEGMKVNIVEG